MDDARRQRVLRQHVDTDRLLGVSAVPLGSAPIAPTPQRTSETSPPASQVQRPAESEPTPAASPASQSPAAPTAPASADGGTLFGPAKQAAPAPNASASTAFGPTPPVYQPITRDEKVRLLDALDVNEVKGCTKCELCHSRTNTVFGEGDPDAQLMFIGEGPGQNEDEQGRPFVGRAGEKLNEMIKAMGLGRQQVFIANIVKCRPPSNRTPTPAEANTCWPFLEQQIGVIQPAVIVTLGGPATKKLLDTKKGITSIRGIWHTFIGLAPAGPAIPVLPTFHPAYLLRAYTPDNRKKVWADLQKVMKYLEQFDSQPAT